MERLSESTFKELYTSTVRGFPYTSKRQHAIDPIKIVKLEWIPYLGLNTLYVKGLAQNTENSKEYSPIVLFKDVDYSNSKAPGYVEIRDNNGRGYVLKRLMDNEILVRCNCRDFFWRGNYADYLDHSLYGRKRSKYLPRTSRKPANPGNSRMVCKHIMKLYKVLEQSGVTI